MKPNELDDAWWNGLLRQPKYLPNANPTIGHTHILYRATDVARWVPAGIELAFWSSHEGLPCVMVWDDGSFQWLSRDEDEVMEFTMLLELIR